MDPPPPLPPSGVSPSGVSPSGVPRPGEPEDDAATTWAMQLAVHAEKTDPPTHSAVCAAAAMAVARVLTEPDERWQEAVRRWEAGPVRKVTRRARGVRWAAVQHVPGVTVEWAGAEVRAFVPSPVTLVPPELAKLQVAGLDLADAPVEDDDVEDDDAAARVPPPEPPYAAIALNPDVHMSTGKAAAQCGHAAHLLVWEAAEPARSAWIAAGIRVHLVRGEPWARSVADAAVAVRDAGFTEVPAGTMTAVARIMSVAE